MELERRFIERRDFPAARRGYDPDEVDRHLREIADAVAELKREQQQQQRTPQQSVGAIASAAAEQVRGIVEAAERSAAEIEQRADDDARRITGEAEAAARETRERADSEAAERVREVEEATRAMLERAREVDREVRSLLEGLRGGAGSLADRLRTAADDLVREVSAASGELTGGVRSSAGSLTSELESMRARLDELGGGRGDGEMAAGEARDKAPSLASQLEEAEEGPEEEEPATRRGAESRLSAVPDEEPEPEPEAEMEPEPEPEMEPEPEAEPEEEPARGRGSAPGGEGARLVALNMALNGTPREETARYLAENFDLDDQDAILDEVYSRVGGG